MLTGFAKKISSLLRAPAKVRKDSKSSDDGKRPTETDQADSSAYLAEPNTNRATIEQSSKPKFVETETTAKRQEQLVKRYHSTEPTIECLTAKEHQNNERLSLTSDREGQDEKPLMLTELASDSDASYEVTVQSLYDTIADEDGATVYSDGQWNSLNKLEENNSTNTKSSKSYGNTLDAQDQCKAISGLAENTLPAVSTDVLVSAFSSEEELLMAELALSKRSYKNATDASDRALKLGILDDIINRLDHLLGGERSRLIQDYVERLIAVENETSWTSPKERTIKELVFGSDCSVRLRNAISKANSLPVRTVVEYMRAPEESREAFKNIPNLGKKSLEELHELTIRAFYSKNFRDGSGDLSTSAQAKRNLDDKTLRAISVAQRMIEGLLFPEDVLNLFPSTRLKNSLIKAYSENSIQFSELLKSYDKVVTKLITQGNFGAKSSQELDKLVTDAIRNQLSAYHASDSLCAGIRQVFADEWIDDENLNALLSFEHVKILPPSKEGISLEWGKTVFEIIANLMDNLSSREREILERRYALDGGEPETLEEISIDHEVTRERIRQIEAKALHKIRTKKIIEVLSKALELEDAIELVFSNRRLVTEEQFASILRDLNPWYRLAIDICYEGLKGYLEHESVNTESGWTLEQYLFDLPEEPEILMGSLRQRLVDVILNETLPISISGIADKFPDLTLEELKQELQSSFAAEIDDDELRAAPRLPTYVRYILILRDAGHALHCKEIRALNHQIFGKDESIQQIGSILGGLDEALIVARGTYDLYENLELSSNELQTIRDIAHQYLEAREEYVSIKVVFSENFQGSTEKFGAGFDYYMLLGILQDDERFDARRGLMVGLSRFSTTLGFLSLNEDIISVLSESSRAMSLEEISAALEGRRDTSLASLATSLENSPLAVSVGRGRYDLTIRAIGQEERQSDLILACSIALADGPRTAFNLSEILRSVWGEIQTVPLLSFLKNSSVFKVEKNTISINELPNEISRYVAMRNKVLIKSGLSVQDSRELRSTFKSMAAHHLTRLDHSLANNDTQSGNRDEMLGLILGDFGVD